MRTKFHKKMHEKFSFAYPDSFHLFTCTNNTLAELVRQIEHIKENYECKQYWDQPVMENGKYTCGYAVLRTEWDMVSKDFDPMIS